MVWTIRTIPFLSVWKKKKIRGLLESPNGWRRALIEHHRKSEEMQKVGGEGGPYRPGRPFASGIIRLRSEDRVPEIARTFSKPGGPDRLPLR